MPFKILEKEQLAPNVFSFWVEAPQIVKKRKPGQFIILRPNAESERVPLTIAGIRPDNGALRLIVQAVGKTTYDLAQMNPGESIRDLAGPLGHPTPVKNYGTVCCIGGGIGVAPMLPIASAMKEVGNNVICIIGARTKDLLILEDDMREASNELLVTTDDGSYVRQGFVTEVLKERMAREPQIDFAAAIGPVPMMKAVAAITREAGIPTIASLNSIMIDGTGMCGGCRVTVGDEVKYTCVDGPEFDAHLVNFDELQRRLSMYREQEIHADEECKLPQFE
jgi:ferredoxin--NADP+ reductase